MTEARSTVDLLTLIGQAIEQLQRSIDAFEASEQNAGVRGLSEVIESIDGYLVHLEQDPLLQMATLDPGSIRGTLHGIQEDLNVVIGEFDGAEVGESDAPRRRSSSNPTESAPAGAEAPPEEEG